jgi:two-component system osmolarity sensor histidine kinase EnvZ
MQLRLQPFLPRSLYGRAALILIVPIVVIQMVVSFTFIQRHYEGVARQMTRNILVELQYILAGVEVAEDRQAAAETAIALANALKMTAVLSPTTPRPEGTRIGLLDFSGRAMAEVLAEGMPGLGQIDTMTDPRRVTLWIDLDAGSVLELQFDRYRVAASNPHQLLAIMILASILMTGVAVVFLRNQVASISRLAQAAEAFGRGENLPYKPSGASEVRVAGTAFLAMRARIDRQIESRTLMLSGVSHDLRTPLTRMKLGMAFLPEDAETEALRRDVAEMERLVDSFLAFVRSDALEETSVADPGEIMAQVAERTKRLGASVAYEEQPAAPIRLRREAMARALDNLASNAARHGVRVRLLVRQSAAATSFVVEDDGPGIAPEFRDQAVEPFQRLDAARDPNRGGGVGLGLSIAADVARSHGGTLRLGASEELGGLKAEIVLPRKTPAFGGGA